MGIHNALVPPGLYNIVSSCPGTYGPVLRGKSSLSSLWPHLEPIEPVARDLHGEAATLHLPALGKVTGLHCVSVTSSVTWA